MSQSNFKHLTTGQFMDFLKTNIHSLVSIKKNADDKYYGDSLEDTGLHDWQYDILCKYIDENLGTEDITEELTVESKDNKVKLPFYLGSMDKIKPDDTDKLSRWINKNNKTNKLIIEEKLDGVSCLVTIKNKKIKMYKKSRNGIDGTDISKLSKYFDIPTTSDINVRGELIIKKNIFTEKYADKYANPRNMVSGITSVKHTMDALTEKILQDIDFVAYEIIGKTIGGTEKSPSQNLEKLQTLGFTTVKTDYLDISNLTMENLSEKLLALHDKSLYEIDGIIIQPDSTYVRNTDDNPSYAFAFKMLHGDSSVANTTVKRVNWNVSKHGVLKPQIEIEPVNLSGVTITFTTGFDAKFIRDNKIGEGAVIRITRSGDVIPHILAVLKKADQPSFPQVEYYWNDAGTNIYATDKESDEGKIVFLFNFFKVIETKNIGKATIEKLYKNGLTSLPLILSSPKDKFSILGGKLGEKIYNNIHERITDKELTVVNLLCAYCAFGEGIGDKKIELLVKNIPDIFTGKISEKELSSKIITIAGFSDLTANKIIKNIPRAISFLEMIKEYTGVDYINPKLIHKNTPVDTPIETVQTNEYTNQIVVFSGFRDNDLKKYIEKSGGKVNDTITKSTTLLLTKGSNETSKVSKAKSMNILIKHID